MRRALFTLVAAAALCAWAGAQGPAPTLEPADQVKLLKTNRILIGNLVDDGLALANAGNPLERATACRGTARSLANALMVAAGNDDPDRVAELADLMTEVIQEGLVPNLEVAERTVQPGSPQAARLAELKTIAAQDLDDIGTAVPAGTQLTDNQKVKAALGAWPLSSPASRSNLSASHQ